MSGSFFDALIAMGGFAQTVSGDVNRYVQQKAQSDLMYFKADMQGKVNGFLRDLENRGDYENWQGEADSFVQGLYDDMEKNSKNNLTARLTNEMITNYLPTLHNEIAGRILLRQTEEMDGNDAAAVKMNLDNLGGQKALDANLEIYSAELARGKSGAYVKAATIQGANNAYVKAYSELGNSMLDDYFNAGKTADQLTADWERQAENVQFDVKMLNSAYANQDLFKKAMETGEGFDDLNAEVDRAGIMSTVAKDLKAKYKARIEERQKENLNTLSQAYGQMIALSPEQRIDYARSVINTINTQMGGNNLAAKDREAQINLFRAFLDPDKQGTDSHGTVKAVGSSMKNLAEGNQEMFLDMWSKGYVSAYAARDAFNDAMLKEYSKLSGIENPTLDDLGKACPAVYGFLDELEKRYPEELRGYLKDVKTVFERDADKMKRDDTGELWGQFTELFFDSFDGIRLSDQKAIEEKKEQLKSELNSFYAKELDWIRANPKNGNLKLEEGVGGISDKKLAEALETAAANPDMVYTDKAGKTKYSLFAAGGTGLERIRAAEEAKLEELGYNPAEFMTGYETDGADDVTAQHVFTNVRTHEQLRFTGKDGVLKLEKRQQGGTWQTANTAKQQKAADEDAEREARSEKAAEFVSGVKFDLRDAPPGVNSADWAARANDKNWQSWKKEQIAEVIRRAEESKDARERERCRAWLEKYGG